MSDTRVRRPVAAGAGAPERTTSFHQTLILIAAYFLGTGGDASIGELVRDVVDDQGRSEVVGAIADGIEDEHELHLSRIVEIRARFLDEAARYEATDDELREALQRGVEEVECSQEAILDARFRLVAEMRADEWEELCSDL